MRKILFFISFFYSVAGFTQFSIKGKVMADSTNHDLSGVNISIQELDRTVYSNEKGEFLFKDLNPGKYTLLFRCVGFENSVKICFVRDEDITLQIPLQKGSVMIGEVVVYGNQSSEKKQTANSIQQIDVNEMRSLGAMNLSDGIAKLPGVSQLSTGSGISKPVIRGLFGNRIQTVLYGLRFDNQQWQDEHGLGLSDVGIDRVEVIKGPSSLLYGSEAMGGVINIIEEKSAPVNSVTADFSTRFFSNTYGNATDIGVKGANEKINWRLRAGYDSHADYSDGNGKRVLNSRYGGYYGKAGFGFNKKKWINQTNYMFTQSNFGFLMDPIQLLDPPDDRLSRNFDRPHHTVDLNIISSQNTFFMHNSKLKLNVGFQNNNRQEQEGGSKISLDMILNTYIGNLTWTKYFNEKVEYSIGAQGFYQTNKNIGSRTIIPDAKLAESSLFNYLKYTASKITLEGGLRYDRKYVQTFATGSINTDPLSPGSMIQPFTRNYDALNGSFGASVYNNKWLNIKANISSGYRAGNLAELSSNGLHEGTVRYEIGNTQLKIEQNICADFFVQYYSRYLNTSASVYHNQFMNYIYLAPSSKEYVGFQIFNYMQHDAIIEGVEANLDLRPFGNGWLKWMNNYSYVKGTLSGGENLPFIPAPKFNSDIKLTKDNDGRIKEIYFKPGISYVFEQGRPGEFETSTADYYLVNASMGTTIKNKRNVMQLSIVGTNLLNNAYYDHLSRFKYFGIYNMGRNVCLNFKIIFN